MIIDHGMPLVNGLVEFRARIQCFPLVPNNAR